MIAVAVLMITPLLSRAHRTASLDNSSSLSTTGECMDWPPKWHSRIPPVGSLDGSLPPNSKRCPAYIEEGLCKSTAPYYGPNWNKKWKKTFGDFQNDGYSALNACCGCGGGCVDAIPGWKSMRDNDCEYYRKEALCTPWGSTGSGWQKKNYGAKLEDDPSANGYHAGEACCACGAGCTNRPRNWQDDGGKSCDDYVRDGMCQLSEAEMQAKSRIVGRTASAACCGCAHGGGCINEPNGWQSSDGTPCSTYAAFALCNSDGTEGPGWIKKWGSIAEYASTDMFTASYGKSALDACCVCGGGIFTE